MAERDWAKEMAKIDRQLESISDEALFPTKTATGKDRRRRQRAPRIWKRSERRAR